MHNRDTKIPWLLGACFVLGLGLGAAHGQVSEERAAQLHAAEGERQVPPAGSPDLSGALDLIIERVNAFRAEHDLRKVATDPRLMETAQDFADFMARTDQIGHMADGRTPSTRAEAHGYELCIISENIAYQYSSQGFSTDALAGRFVQGWKDSPSHRKNILEPAVTQTGVAIARSEATDHYYAVQMFGRPRTAAIEFAVGNRADATVEYSVDGQSFSLPPRYTRTHQQCRTAQLTFDWPGAQDDTQVQAKDGDRYTIVRSGSGTLELRGE